MLSVSLGRNAASPSAHHGCTVVPKPPTIILWWRLFGPIDALPGRLADDCSDHDRLRISARLPLTDAELRRC